MPTVSIAQFENQMKSPTFKESLAIGKKYEKVFFNWLLKYKLEPEHMIGNFKEYDIRSGLLRSTFEVKTDLRSKKSNQWVIEYDFGAPSGMSTTTADFWVFTNGDSFWYVLTDTLRQSLLDLPMVDMTGEGDKEPKDVKFLSHEELCKIATKLNYLDMDLHK